MSLAFVDLDRFKHINDTGHEEGDRALIAIADLMKAAFRESDILARQGGRIYHSVRQYQPPRCRDGDGDAQPQRGAFQPAGGQSWQLAFSWGCVEYDPASHPSLNALVATADRLMYQAKQKQGRERR